MHIHSDTLSDSETLSLQAVGDRIVFIFLNSPLSYSAAIAFTRYDELSARPRRAVIYEISRSTVLDESMALTICDLIESSQSKGRHVILTGLKGHLVGSLQRAGVFGLLPASQCFETRGTAIDAAIAYCRTNGGD